MILRTPADLTSPGYPIAYLQMAWRGGSAENSRSKAAELAACAGNQEQMDQKGPPRCAIRRLPFKVNETIADDEKGCQPSQKSLDPLVQTT